MSGEFGENKKTHDLKESQGLNLPWRTGAGMGEEFLLIFCRRYSMKTTHNRIRIATPPIPPIVAPIVVIRLDREFITEGGGVVSIGGVIKGKCGASGAPSGRKGNGSVKSVVEGFVIVECGNPADEAEEGDDCSFRDPSGG